MRVSAATSYSVARALCERDGGRESLESFESFESFGSCESFETFDACVGRR